MSTIKSYFLELKSILLERQKSLIMTANKFINSPTQKLNKPTKQISNMEKIIGSRKLCFIRSNNFSKHNQLGFKSCTSTTNAQLHLQHFASNWATKNHVPIFANSFGYEFYIRSYGTFSYNIRRHKVIKLFSPYEFKVQLKLPENKIIIKLVPDNEYKF